jgi:hypothetical protein
MEHDTLMTRLKQSWKSDESIFEMFEDKPIAGAQLKSLTGMIPIFRMLADVYYTVKEGKQEEALVMLDIMGSWIQAGNTKEANDRMQEYVALISTADFDNDLKEFMNGL